MSHIAHIGLCSPYFIAIELQIPFPTRSKEETFVLLQALVGFFFSITEASNNEVVFNDFYASLTCSVCSVALIKSTAFCNVKSFHQSNLSRILSSRIPSTVLSRKISSGVILSCWQFFAIVLNSVRYDAMLSPGSWLRLLNR